MAATYVARPSRKLWGAVRVWAWLYIAASSLVVAAMFWRLSLMRGIPGDAYMTEMHVIADFVPGAGTEIWLTLGASILMMATYLVSVVLVLMWYLRSVRNAHALVNGMQTSPKWAIWFFIIPLISLWKPYGMTSELWRSSHKPDGWRGTADVPLIRWWWGLVLFSGFSSTAANATSRAAQTVAQMGISDMWLIASAGLAVAAGLLFLHIGGRITDLQNRMIETGREKPAPEAGRFAD